MPNLVVLIVDDHPLVVSGCQSLLTQDDSIKVISAGDQKGGYQSYMENRPDVTVVDINLPDLSGFELLRQIRKEDPEAGVIVLSMNDEPTFVVRAVELGAKGFVSKNDDPRLLLKAVQTVAKGESFIASNRAQEIAFAAGTIRSDPASHLSARELETLRLLARGHRIGKVAETLGVSYKTVANTASLLKHKLNVSSNSELIRKAIDMGFG